MTKIKNKNTFDNLSTMLLQVVDKRQAESVVGRIPVSLDEILHGLC